MFALLRAVAIAVAAAFLSAVTVAAGQVIRDGTVGPAGALPGPDFVIPDTDGQTRGNNLFHSFSQFNLNNEFESATFTGPANIHNVIARVTGGNASTINGTLNCAIDGANFFFINPFGVIFGEHAQVNVSGSFAVTTADYVKLADGGRFDARNPANDILTAAPVSAFGFLGPTPAPITIGTGDFEAGDPFVDLEAAAGQTLSVIAGNIQIGNANVGADSGRINLISVASTGELALDTTDLFATIDTGGFSQLGQVRIANFAFVDASSYSGGSGGKVAVNADSLSMANLCQILADNYGSDAGQGIEIRLRGELSLANVAQIAAFAIGDGDGGNIEISASSVHLDGQADVLGGSANISTENLGAGKAGNISISTGSLVVENGAAISATAGELGNGGNIDILADSILLDGRGFEAAVNSKTFGGTAGEIHLSANTIELRAGGSIGTDTFRGSSAGGNVFILASTLRLDGTGQAPLLLTRITSTSDQDATGPGGNIVLDVNHLEIANAAQISTTTFTDGTAGDIAVSGRDAIIAGHSSIQSAAAGLGGAGGITLQLTGSLLLRDGGALNVSSTQGNGGDITVNAGSAIRLINGQINAQAFGDGGNVHLNAPSFVYLLHSQIRAESTEGNGGNITIDPQLIVLNNSLIKASAIVGNGGDISIVSDFFLASHSVIDASSEFGLQGTVNITSPNADLAGNFIGLDADPLDAESRLRPHCAVRLPTGVSSFTIVGRGGAPIEPDGLLPALPAALPK